MARVPLWPPFASAISRGLLDHPEEAPRDRRSWNVFRRGGRV
jgi:sulfoquinovose isomerase